MCIIKSLKTNGNGIFRVFLSLLVIFYPIKSKVLSECVIFALRGFDIIAVKRER